MFFPEPLPTTTVADPNKWYICRKNSHDLTEIPDDLVRYGVQVKYPAPRIIEIDCEPGTILLILVEVQKVVLTGFRKEVENYIERKIGTIHYHPPYDVRVAKLSSDNADYIGAVKGVARKIGLRYLADYIEAAAHI
uniref:Methyl-coenzyme M reductase operon protein D n=1 Tax=Panagrellus redivivus TaxID=6233 RepID=A0A7E4VZV6_PANRE